MSMQENRQVKEIWHTNIVGKENKTTEKELGQQYIKRRKKKKTELSKEHLNLILKYQEYTVCITGS